jgi:folate-binding protein YgfZ
MSFLLYDSPSITTGIITGKESRLFLNRLCTLNFKNHPHSHQSLSFFLNAKGQLQNAFEVHQILPSEISSSETSTHSLWRMHALSSELSSELSLESKGPPAPGSIHQLMENLDLYHFGEDVSFSLKKEQKRLIILISPDQFSTVSHNLNLPDQCSISTFNRRVSTDQNQAEPPLYTSPMYSFEDGYVGEYLPWFSTQSSSPLLRILFEGPSSWIDSVCTRLLALKSPPLICTVNEMIHHLRTQGMPLSPSEYRDQLNPLEMGLYGISEGKGCYPGQEVIERTLALGKPPRRFIFLQSTSSFNPSQTSLEDPLKLGIYTEDHTWIAVGRLTSWTSTSSIPSLSTDMSHATGVSYAWGWIKHKHSTSTLFYTSNEQKWTPLNTLELN